MSVINSVALLMGDEGYQISRSVRLRSSASAYFSRSYIGGTSPADTSTQIKTYSIWAKRGTLNSTQVLMSNRRDGSNFWHIYFDANNALNLQHYSLGSSTSWLITNQVFRDPSAWYHIVVAVDTTQATAANRLKLYINGVQATFTGSAYMSQNSNDLAFLCATSNTWTACYGAYNIPSTFYDGYIAEIYTIDGQALTPSSFGETDLTTGVWKPKKYAGTYGTNGFYLNFSDNSNNTAATIGKDYSGNGNNWTPNNISVTTGSTYDSMLDTPTPYADGGNGRGNYAVLNPINTLASGATVSGGNLNIVGASASAYGSPATMLLTSGKWYFEVVAGAVASRYPVVGVQTELTAFLSSGFPGGYTANGFGYGSDGNKYVNNGAAAAFGSTFTSGDVIGVAIDVDAGKVWLSKNSTWQASGDPVAGTNAAYTVTAGTALYPCVGTYNGAGTHSVNFGQRPFTYTPPTGFKALNTQNLPEPTIKKGNQYFNATTYTGNGTSLTVTNSGSMQPDLVWIKDRTGGNNHMLFDSVRGVLIGLTSNSTSGEASFASSLTSFNSNGFSVGNYGNVNLNSSSNYIGWQWKEGATPGFDIVTYTGTGANRTVAHSLGVAPSMVIVKRRNTTSDWVVWHSAISAANYLSLNLTSASTAGATIWNSTAPTSSVFSVGTSVATNGSSDTYVAYLFAEVAGFSKFGSYTGNGSADGPFVFCGFRPRFVLIKRTDASASNWQIFDTARSTYNVNVQRIFANDPSAELTGEAFDILSNGFKPRLSGTGTDSNSTGGTYIYAAFAENPFKYSLAR